jgi:ubiquitin thioesterase CYLD
LFGINAIICFFFFSVFDSLLFRPQTEKDVPQYQEVQRVLREEIVNPLRQNLYVRADRVMKLRTLLENLSSVTGLTSEEKGNNTEMPLRCYRRSSAA